MTRPEQLRPTTVEEVLDAIARLTIEGPTAVEIVFTSKAMRDVCCRLLAVEAAIGRPRVLKGDDPDETGRG